MDEKEKDAFLERLAALRTNNIHLSAHTINGWQGQYSLMMRFYNRAKSAESNPDEIDFWIAFFQNCFHLKDWLKGAVKGGLDKAWNERLEVLIKTDNAMMICGDICNSAKHLRLSKPKIDKYPAIFYEYNPFHKPDERNHNWIVYINNKKYKLSSIAYECITFWNTFIKTENLIK